MIKAELDCSWIIGEQRIKQNPTRITDMAFQLYDTYSRSLQEFNPIEPGKVRLYACGPTVYDYAHIGNLRTYVFEDVLRRIFEYKGFAVEHVVNITDVGHLTSDGDTGEDKMEKGSRKAGATAWEIAQTFTEAFESDIARLNILEPTIWCKATDHIQEQIADIEKIEAKGFAYTTSDGVYFDTSKLDSYGYLARLDKEGLNQGARVDQGEKKNPTDFALWKFSVSGEQRQMEWDSPWGVGFPGWHIECSAMAVKYLGERFDIHCGGKDHIPVHHSNEIAQAEVCYGTNLANYWLHGYFLETDNAKMSKSSGDFLRIQTLLDRQIDPLSYRYLCLTAHYRSDLKFTWESLESAETALNRLRAAMYSWEAPSDADQDMLSRFMAEVDRDMNTAKALAIVWSLVKSDLDPSVKKATLFEMDKVLGLGLSHWQPKTLDIPDSVLEMVEARRSARAEKNWALADEIRDRIIAEGYELVDSAEGTGVRLKKS